MFAEDDELSDDQGLEAKYMAVVGSCVGIKLVRIFDRQGGVFNIMLNSLPTAM